MTNTVTTEDASQVSSPTNTTSHFEATSVASPTSLAVTAALWTVLPFLYGRTLAKETREMQLAECGSIFSTAAGLIAYGQEGQSAFVSLAAGLAVYFAYAGGIRLSNALLPANAETPTELTPALGTVKDLYEGGHKTIRSAVETLYRRMIREKRLLRFLGFEEASFTPESLVSAIADMNVHEGIREGRSPWKRVFHAKEGEFDCQAEVLHIGGGALSTVAHEMLHALHFSALATRMTEEEMRRIIALYDRADPSISDGLKKDLQAVLDFLDGPGGDLTPALKRASARLLFSIRPPGLGAKLEALASRFDVSLGGVRMFLGRFYRHTVGILMRPLVFLAGIRRNNNFDNWHGYSNPLLYNRMMREGLFRSLLP